jgi:hypothetical protein
VKGLLLGLLLINVVAIAQTEADTTVVEDFAFEEFDEDYSDDIIGAADTTEVLARSFSDKTISELKRDSDLQYEAPPTIAQSLWQRFLIWLSEMIASVFSSAVETNWGRVVSYLLGIGVLVLVILLILKIDAFKILYTNQGASTIKYSVLHENIHEIDFDQEIQNAVDNGDHRRGVRLLFLYALKILSDKQYIHWEQGKTNHDYVAEVKEETLRNWLNQLSYYFDYAWYGNFTVSKELFDRVNLIFTDWKGKVR